MNHSFRENQAQSASQEFAQELLYRVGSPLTGENAPAHRARRVGAAVVLAVSAIGIPVGIFVFKDAVDRLNGPECIGKTTYEIQSGEGLDAITTQVLGYFDHRDIRNIVEDMNPDRIINGNVTTPGEYFAPSSCEY